MPFKKNDPNINTDGRQKGSQNRYTKDVKEAFGMLLQGNLDNLSLWLEQIAETDPKAAMDIVIRLSERFVPKLSQQQITDGEGGDLFKNLKFRFGGEKNESE